MNCFTIMEYLFHRLQNSYQIYVPIIVTTISSSFLWTWHPQITLRLYRIGVTCKSGSSYPSGAALINPMFDRFCVALTLKFEWYFIVARQYRTELPDFCFLIIKGYNFVYFFLWLANKEDSAIVRMIVIECIGKYINTNLVFTTIYLKNSLWQ